MISLGTTSSICIPEMSIFNFSSTDIFSSFFCDRHFWISRVGVGVIVVIARVTHSFTPNIHFQFIE